MKQLKTKVIMSAFVLLFALVATIGSTYAWFTVSTVVSVSSISLNVQSDESLLILVDQMGDAGTPGVGYDYPSNVNDALVLDNATNYVISLDNTDIASSTLYSPSLYTLGTVTAGYGFANDGAYVTYTGLGNGTPNVVTLYTVSLTDKSHTATTNNNSATGDYIQFDFWLLSQSSTTEDVVLQDLTISGDSENSAGQDTVIDALRLMTHVSTFDDQVFSRTAPDYGFAFESGMPGYNLPAAWGNSVLAADQSVLVAAGGLYYGALLANASTNVIGDATVVATLASNTPTKVSVIIFIEGWDAQATTDILNAGFDISFKFALQDVAA
ncbi:MAG: hypothetical protein KAU02_05315 [Tenericutes bacterium]|nr:hypothetical protein [Mycoplasmatota bacterium]